MINSISSAVKGGYGNAILYAGALGLLFSDIIPTPADALYFNLQQKNKAKLQSKEITPKQYWTRDAIYYYGLNPLWWSVVLGAMYLTKGDYTKKAKIGIGLLASGVVIAVLNGNIKKDEELQQKIVTT
jgi:hypothetical protein